MEPVLSSISILCPSVSDFHFNDHAVLGSLIDTSAALLSWSHLLSVRTEMVSDAAILHLANLPSLQKLDLKLNVQSITIDTQAILQHSAFFALRELSIRCLNFASSDAFFKKLSIAPKRLYFTIDVETDLSQAAIPASMSRISDACACNALEHLQIAILEDEYLATPIGPPVFQPFYVFCNLHRFKFHTNCKVELDDAMLLQMAKSWPLLKELAIRAENIDNLQYFTTNAFVVLLQHCLHLTSVEMDVDWYDIDQCDMSLEVPYEGFAHENPSRANFGSSRIEYAAAITSFLSAIAPNLERICAWEYDYHIDSVDEFETYSPRWTTVHQLVGEKKDDKDDQFWSDW